MLFFKFISLSKAVIAFSFLQKYLIQNTLLLHFNKPSEIVDNLT